MAEIKSSNEWKPFIAMLAVEFAFATVNILLKKVVDEGINHLVLITYRLFISAAFLGPMCYFFERNSRSKLTFRILCYLFLSAIVGASLTQFFFLLGIQYTSATFACAFINIVPVITFIVALPFGLESANIKSKSGRAKVLGSVVCVGGAMVLTIYRGTPLFRHPQRHYHQVMEQGIKLSWSKKAERWTIGCVALIVGVVLWSSWFILQSNVGNRFPYQYSSTAIMSFFGAIQSAVLCFSTQNNLSIWALKGRVEILTVLYAGMVGSGLCYVGMSWCVKQRGPVFTSAFSPLVQIMAAIFDIPILHEELHLGSLLGSIIVIIGLYILLWGKNKEMQYHAAKVAQENEQRKEIESQSQSQAVPVSCDARCP